MLIDKVEGFLTVGYNDSGEVVVNHPDLKPDVDGVGHIVFSPQQARNLADLLIKHAWQAEQEVRRRQEVQARAAAEAIPVDRSARVLTNGAPVTEDHREINPATGQQKAYVVLSPEERAKGFVRPVRRSYQHIGAPAPKYDLRDLTDEEMERYPEYVKFEPYPENESPVTGYFWKQSDLDNIGKGCGTVTTMALAIAETLARDPEFYGGGFCSGCMKHFPMKEFVWAGTSEPVGS